MSTELMGIFSIGVMLLVGLVGLSGLTGGLRLRLHGELLGDLRRFREDNSRQHSEVGVRIDAPNARVDGQLY